MGEKKIPIELIKLSVSMELKIDEEIYKELEGEWRDGKCHFEYENLEKGLGERKEVSK